MRDAYNEQMNELANLLGEMAALAGSAMDTATQSLLQADLVLAEQVISDHDKITDLSAVCEEKAFTLLALQAPVAGDLRSVVSGIQIVADIVVLAAPTEHHGHAHDRYDCDEANHSEHDHLRVAATDVTAS